MNAPNKKVLALLAKHKASNAKFKPTAAQVKEMKKAEPSEGQVLKLKGMGVTDDQIAGLSKYDASEMIEKLEVARNKAGSITESQMNGLIAWGVAKADLVDLTFYEASALFDGVTAGKPRKPF